MAVKLRHFVSISDLSSSEILKVLGVARKLKREVKTKKGNKKVLSGKTLVTIYEKPSLRTRISFEIGMTQLGGNSIYLAPTDIQMGTRESISDISIVTSSMADIIMARTFAHETVVELAKYSSVPVINGLTELEHPCQILADLLTIKETKKKLQGLTVAFVGDCNNNVVHSFALACALLKVNFRACAPKGYFMNKTILSRARDLATKSEIVEVKNPNDAVANADVVVTDTWVSMGRESEKKERLKIFNPFQVNLKLMGKANKNAIFMHCLPAYRGSEVTAEVIDGPQSVVFQEAENRLHAQKALMLTLLNLT